jgi:hypothetical protein
MMSHAPPSGSKGGLLLAWCHGVDIECILASVNIINVRCYSNPPNYPWLLSCIYGPLAKQHKPMFWDSLLDVGMGYHGPWLCVGDFNMILSDLKIWWLLGL